MDECHRAPIGAGAALGGRYCDVFAREDAIMKIGIIGSGVVGQTLGAKLVDRGEDIALGTRSPGNLGDKRGFGKPLDEWLTATGSRAGHRASGRSRARP